MPPNPGMQRTGGTDEAQGLAARSDAYLLVRDPDALVAEIASRNVDFSEPLNATDDGLRGFELKDSDGYVLFFGHPRSWVRTSCAPMDVC